MEEARSQIRSMAWYALNQLIQQDSSVEVAVRAVLRIATLLGQARWQVWAYLQLTDFYEADALDGAHELIEAAFPDLGRRNDIIDFVMKDVRWTRRTGVDDDDTYYLADIGDIEQDVPVFQARLIKKISVRRFADRDMRHRILNRVKNRVQTYLMAVEAGRTIPEPSAD